MTHYIIDCDGLLYQACHNVKTVTKAYDKLLDKVTQITCDDWDDNPYTLFVGGKGNWRKDVFPHYKAPRGGKPLPPLIGPLKDYLVANKLAIASKGCEADDLVRRKAETMKRRGQDYVVVSGDKDLDCIVGKHIRFTQYFTMDYYDIDEEASDYNFFYQLMYGDMTDNIKHPTGLGPAAIKKLLAETPKDQWRKMVENEYKTRCGSEWLHALYFTGSLVYIQEYQGAMFNWGKRGTWYDLGFQGYPSCYKYTAKQLGG